MQGLIAFTVAVVGSVAGIACIGLVSGWSKLAKKYPGDSTDADWHGWKSGKIGAINYNHCLWVAVDPSGLHMKTGPLFLSVMHPPLMIPWSAIDSAVEDKILWKKFFNIQISDPKMSVLLESSALDGADVYLGCKLRRKPD